MTDWWQGLHGLAGIVAGADVGDPGDDQLALEISGRRWWLDAAAGDSVTLVDDNGMTIYADMDGDGEVDHISTVHSAGGFEVWSADPHVEVWGLPGAEVADVPSGHGAGWGLPQVSTPEIGSQNGGVDHETGGWRCVDRG